MTASTLSPTPPPTPPAIRFLREHRAALLLLGALLVFRLWYAGVLGMAEDEMYYWQWSRHLASSYYDQGPGIAYIIRLGTLLFGSTPFGIRIVGLLMGIGTGWLTYRLVDRLVGRSAALWGLVLINAAPLMAVGTIIATYDGPQVFFWVAALCALLRTLETDRASGWYAVGIFVALGLLCKLTMLLFAPGALLVLLLSPRYRKWLATPHPWLAFAVALLGFVPILLWNAHHGWMGFLHTVTLGSRRQDAKPFRWFGDFLGGQAIALGPFLFLAEFYAVGRLTLRAFDGLRAKTAADDTRSPGWGLAPEASRFLLAFAAPTLLLCLVVSLKSKMEINWPAPAHITGIALVGCWFAEAWNRRKDAAARGLVAVSAGFSILLTLILFFPSLLTLPGKPVSEKLAEKLNQPYGWDQIMTAVQSARENLEREGKPVFVAGINYRSCSALAFGLPDKPPVQCLFLLSRRCEYVVWDDTPHLIGDNCLLCFDDANQDAVDLAGQYFASVTPVSVVEVRRPGFEGDVKRWYLYACRGWKGYDPMAHVAGY